MRQVWQQYRQQDFYRRKPAAVKAFFVPFRRALFKRRYCKS